MRHDVQQRAAEVIEAAPFRVITSTECVGIWLPIIACTACGALVAPDARTDHAEWHERNRHG